MDDEFEDEDEFLVWGENGEIVVKITKVYSFPDTTSFRGGYDTVCQVTIRAKEFTGNGSCDISTGEMYVYYTELEECYRKLKGEAKLLNHEATLMIVTKFDDLGHVEHRGYLRDYEGNKLEFTLRADQTMVFSTIVGLGDIQHKYGDMRGKKK